VLAVLNGTAHATYWVLELHTDTPQAQIVAQLMITTEWSDWRNGVIWWVRLHWLGHVRQPASPSRVPHHLLCRSGHRWIQSVYVPPEQRQKGHFKSLYHAVRAEARKAGVTGLRLYADTANKRAQSACEFLCACLLACSLACVLWSASQQALAPA
jgi:GNAT superfamily N-acetyltransferase